MRALVTTFCLFVLAAPVAAQPEEEDDFGISTPSEPAPEATPAPSPEPEATVEPPAQSPEPPAEAPPEEEAEEAEVTEAVEEAVEEQPSAPAAHWDDLRIAGWTSFALSIAIGVTGGLVLAVGVDEQTAVENAPDGIEWSALSGAYERAPILQGVGAATLAIGVAGVAVGAILLALGGRAGTWLEAAPSAAGPQLRARF